MLSKKNILIVVIVVALVAVGAVYILTRGDEPAAEEMANINQGGQVPPGSGLPGGGEPGTELPEPSEPARAVTSQERDQVELKNTAKFFVETLGSYSPDARFQNVIDLEGLMTAKMRSWADDFVARNLPNVEEGGERATTQVFKSDILSYSNRSARVLMETRREKTNSSGSGVYNQEVEVAMIKIGSTWLVDEVEWL